MRRVAKHHFTTTDLDWRSLAALGNPVVLLTACLALALLSLANGCSQSQIQHEVSTTPTPTPPPPPAVVVTISPQSLAMKPGDSEQFVASVGNATDQKVTWSIREGSAGGVISDAGVYTAPDVDGSYHVIATSKVDPTKSAVASVSVAGVSVSISPQVLELKQGAEWSFSATVSNAKDKSVTWSIAEGPAGGAISDAGVYTAPAVDGSYHVVATSKEDSTKNAAATVRVAASASSFIPTGGLAYPRVEFTATLLADGEIFIAGGVASFAGVSGPIALESHAEQYDPVQGAFHSAGTVTRVFHTATRLANGDVLFAGGTTDYSAQPAVVTASAELLKADTGLLQPTGNMVTPRTGHMATLLQDGRVLIIGGGLSGNDIATNTAEIYDPASGTFSLAVNTIGAGFPYSATLLLNGKVLITGWSFAELYDPVANTFTATGGGNLNFGAGYTATLLADGKVLIAGGEIEDDGVVVGSSEVFDPVTEQFTASGALAIPRWDHTATLLPDGTVLIAGGFVDIWGDDPPTETTEIYDPITGTFGPGPAMAQRRAGHSATLLSDNSVLIVGGWGLGGNRFAIAGSAEICK